MRWGEMNRYILPNELVQKYDTVINEVNQYGICEKSIAYELNRVVTRSAWGVETDRYDADTVSDVV